MRIAVSAVQGDFAEHEQVWKEMGIDCIELRSRGDLRRSYDALVLPGGESTVQGKLLRELGMFEPLRKQIRSGLPVLATCAGLILLAEKIANDERSYFQTLPVTVRRNAYGRQLGSFHTVGFCGDLGAIPMTFIRAPYIESAAPSVEVLATVDGKTVAVKYQNQLGLSFHPELDADRRLYRLFTDLISRV